ncbi:Restriction alleviation protein, Lar family, partial [Dysosmobacter welbionis]
QDDVRLAEEGLGQQHLHLLLGGQRAHLAVQNVLGQSQALDQAAHVALRLPAVHVGKLRLQFAGLHTVGVGEVLLGVEGVLLLHDIVEPLVAHDD